jgi:hypothetical protein
MVPDVRRLLTLLVYAVAIVLGGGVLVPDPTHPLLAVPLLSGAGVLAHAVTTDHLDQAGYAIAGMWAAVLATSVVTGVVGLFADADLAPLTGLPIASLAGTVGVTAVLVAGYLFTLRRRGDAVVAG